MSQKNRKQNRLFRTVSDDRKTIFKIGIVLLAVILAAGVGIFCVYRNQEKEAKEVEETVDEYEKYVGPEEAEDRGEWVDSVGHYGFYGGSGAEGDVAGMLFPKDGEDKGIVAAGLMLQPVLVTYEDFEPYGAPGDFGFMTDYACTSDPQEIEVQLGRNEGMQITGSYRNEQNDLFYEGRVQVDLKNIRYFTELTYDRDAALTGEQEPGYYGYIQPDFLFDYEITGEARVTDNYPDYLGELSFSAAGSLKPAQWQFTSSLSGQGNEIFRVGEVYVRCKLPCQVRKKVAGKTENYESSVNIYFRINETRIGTRADCIPPEALHRMREAAETEAPDTGSQDAGSQDTRKQEAE